MKQLMLSIFLLVCMTTISGTFAQSNPPTFQDDLLDHLVGKWDATGTVHGRPSRQTFEADWALNHQFLSDSLGYYPRKGLIFAFKVGVLIKVAPNSALER